MEAKFVIGRLMEERSMAKPSRDARARAREIYGGDDRVDQHLRYELDELDYDCDLHHTLTVTKLTRG